MVGGQTSCSFIGPKIASGAPAYSHCWKGFKYKKMPEKPKTLWELKDFSEEQQQFNCSGQTRDS